MDEKIVKDSQGLAKDLVNDTISRQVMIDLIEDDSSNGVYSCFASYKDAQKFKQKVMDLSPAQPKRKRGKWIEDDDGWDEVIWRCSECDAVFTLVDGTPEENEYYFCPHCGADMRGEQDDESRSNSNAQTDTRARGMGATDKSSGI